MKQGPRSHHWRHRHVYRGAGGPVFPLGGGRQEGLQPPRGTVAAFPTLGGAGAGRRTEARLLMATRVEG